MPYEWQPGFIFYKVEWRRDGQCVFSFATFAKDEDEALRQVEDFFSEHPEYEITGVCEGTTIRVGRVVERDGRTETVFPDDAN
jgi:hypothetical protein